MQLRNSAVDVLLSVELLSNPLCEKEKLNLFFFYFFFVCVVLPATLHEQYEIYTRSKVTTKVN